MIPWADYIRNNFWLKIFSLGLAMIIWFAVRSDAPDKMSFPLSPWKDEIPRSLTNLPVALLIRPYQGQRFTVSPVTVDVTVNGPREIINRLNPADIKIYAQILDVNSPMATFPLKPITPKGVTVRSISPSSVTVESTSEPFRLFPQNPIN